MAERPTGSRHAPVSRPSWPSSLEPHVYTVPSAASATVCMPPQATCSTCAKPRDRVGGRERCERKRSEFFQVRLRRPPAVPGCRALAQPVSRRRALQRWTCILANLKASPAALPRPPHPALGPAPPRPAAATHQLAVHVQQLGPQSADLLSLRVLSKPQQPKLAEANHKHFAGHLRTCKNRAGGRLGAVRRGRQAGWRVSCSAQTAPAVQTEPTENLLLPRPPTLACDGWLTGCCSASTATLRRTFRIGDPASSSALRFPRACAWLARGLLDGAAGWALDRRREVTMVLRNADNAQMGEQRAFWPPATGYAGALGGSSEGAGADSLGSPGIRSEPMSKALFSFPGHLVGKFQPGCARGSCPCLLCLQRVSAACQGPQTPPQL